MGLAALRRGQRITLNGVHFELMGRLPSGNWQLMEVETGVRDEQSSDALWSAFSEHRLRFVASEDIGQSTAMTRLRTRLSEASASTPHPANEAELKDALGRQRYVQEITNILGNNVML